LIRQSTPKVFERLEIREQGYRGNSWIGSRQRRSFNGLEILPMLKQLNFAAGAALPRWVAMAGCTTGGGLLAGELAKAIQRVCQQQNRGHHKQDGLPTLQITE
jgi:hypothetical protein